MLTQPLVSVITPCYNGEKWVGRLIESVLNQTYGCIEFIIVNDGSTDNSETVILSYEERFKERGFLFRYVRQENKGLGGAINAGLKLFTGDYLCWPDADDYLEPTSVEDRLVFLEANRQFAAVASNAYVRRYDDLEHTIGLEVSGNRKNQLMLCTNWFDLLLDEEAIFCSGCHMIKASAFLDVNPQRELYPARRGQNWQMLLPVYFKYKAAFLDKPLYNYIDYPGSMSKSRVTLMDTFARYGEHEEIILHTLTMIEKIQGADMEKYRRFIMEKYIGLRMSAALHYGDFDTFYEQYELKKEYGLTWKDRLSYLRAKVPCLDAVVCALRSLRR